MSRKFTGTMIGAAAGFFMAGGIMGAIIGGVLGNMFDKSSAISTSERPADASGRRRRQAFPRVREFVFVSNLVALMTSVAKADKKIHPEEIRAINNFFERSFHYSGHDGKVITSLIREAAGRKLDLKALTEDTRNLLEYPEQLMLVRILYAIALSDRVFKDVERNRIQQIVDYLRISPADHDHIKNEFSIAPDVDNYAILETTPGVTDKKVKEAYRQMVKKYHPDKVSHLGKDFTELAHEKFQKIQEAYQKIAQERSFD